tara:strand:- start:412 stop:624 length:213 start_codon:yes stop_codon:yes gene_type:complete
MKFTKLENGKYKFEGVDSWNGQWIEGEITHQPWDVLLKQQWQVVFTNIEGHCDVAFFGPTLKSCKEWLTQ